MEHPRTVAQRSWCLWTIRPNGSIWLPAFTKAFNTIVIKLQLAQRKNCPLFRYLAIIVISVKVAQHRKNSTSASPARKQSKVRVKSRSKSRGRLHVRAPRKAKAFQAKRWADCTGSSVSCNHGSMHGWSDYVSVTDDFWEGSSVLPQRADPIWGAREKGEKNAL